MKKSFYKFGFLEDEKSKVYNYGNLWCIENYPNYSRIVAAPSNNQINLILDLLKNFEPPYLILYVLTVSRTENKVGRYQCIKPLSFSEVNDFSKEYSQYFETDGRHHLWLGSASSNKLLVYDNHNVIYIYNDKDDAINTLKEKGFIERSITFPVPHEHKYNEENDKYEVKIINKHEWKWFPLQEQDEN